MKKTNQKGFSLIEGLLIFVVVIIVVGTGVYVYRKVINDQTAKPSGDTTQKITKETEQKKSEFVKTPTKTLGTTILEVNLKLSSPADISKLPDTTPASFKAFLLNKLKTDEVDVDGCKPVYIITKISAVNIKGGTIRKLAVSSGNKDDCITGGSPNLWVLAPDKNWDYVTLNGPTCTSKNGGIVYEEFATECATSDKSYSYVKNPNGSIANLSL